MRGQLNGAVVNASCTTPLGDAPEHLCCILIWQDVHVHGEHQHAGLDGPHMQVVDVFHSFNGVEAICKQQTSTDVIVVLAGLARQLPAERHPACLLLEQAAQICKRHMQGWSHEWPEQVNQSALLAYVVLPCMKQRTPNVLHMKTM